MASPFFVHTDTKARRRPLQRTIKSFLLTLASRFIQMRHPSWISFLAFSVYRRRHPLEKKKINK